MRRFRFTIANLLGVVLFAALAVAALREATELWDSAVFTLTLGVLLTSVVLAVHRTGERRAYWVGFALFGAAYTAGSLITPIESRLLTTRGLAYLDALIPGRGPVYGVTFGFSSNAAAAQPFSFIVDGGTLTEPPQGGVRLWNVTAGNLLAGSAGSSENFVRIGHSLLSLLAALAGGSLSRRLAAARRRPVDDRADPARDDALAVRVPPV